MCRIIAALSLEERGLFKERIKVLDKRIHPGLTKLTWASKNVSDYFVAECRLHASKIQANVDDYKGANMNIRELCVKISEMLLVRIDSKTVYEDLKFDEDQARHRENVQKRLKHTHEDIIASMRGTFQVFQNDGNEVRKYYCQHARNLPSFPK